MMDTTPDYREPPWASAGHAPEPVACRGVVLALGLSTLFWLGLAVLCAALTT